MFPPWKQAEERPLVQVTNLGVILNVQGKAGKVRQEGEKSQKNVVFLISLPPDKWSLSPPWRNIFKPAFAFVHDHDEVVSLLCSSITGN